jgi:hypothetical protein
LLLSLGFRDGRAGEETNTVISEVEDAARPFTLAWDAGWVAVLAVLVPKTRFVQAVFEIICLFSVVITRSVPETQPGNSRTLARVCSALICQFHLFIYASMLGSDLLYS